MSPTYLTPGVHAPARSPMEREARRAGAEIERRDGWDVAVRFQGEEPEARRRHESVGFADVSHLGKIEIQARSADLASIVAAGGAGALELGRATRTPGAWWCPYTPERAIVLCDTADTAALLETLEQAAGQASGFASVLDVTCVFGALTIAGPLARETFARFTALDLRPRELPLNGFRPGSVARTPGAVLREGDDRFLMTFGFALGQYVWTVVADAAQSLGGGPVGVDALESIDELMGAAEVSPGA